MASAQSTVAVNMIAGEDLRGDLFEILQVEDDGGIGKVIKATAVTQVVVGVLAEEPRTDITTDGETVPVALLQGIVKLKAGGTVTAGDLVVPDSTPGRVVTVATIAAMAIDSFALGIALKTAADGEIFEMLAFPMTSATDA
ncbi:MAG: hypothetical protein V3S55_15480 [Nitrospiraceae bacterium]